MNELVAYELPEGDEAGCRAHRRRRGALHPGGRGGGVVVDPVRRPVLRARGDASCGSSRAVSELAGDQVIEASDWSAGRYLTVPAAPFGQGECSARWTCCGGWNAANGGGSLMLSSAAATVTAAAPVPAGVADAGRCFGNGIGIEPPSEVDPRRHRRRSAASTRTRRVRSTGIVGTSVVAGTALGPGGGEHRLAGRTWCLTGR